MDDWDEFTKVIDSYHPFYITHKDILKEYMNRYKQRCNQGKNLLGYSEIVYNTLALYEKWTIKYNFKR